MREARETDLRSGRRLFKRAWLQMKADRYASQTAARANAEWLMNASPSQILHRFL